ncbi:MAG: ABC transporter ATP-binding protein [Gammaproteobacteria bacterium]|nr:ABC transporter ATP-binding protein [Gammaproteobacteria bacterium]
MTVPAAVEIIGVTKTFGELTAIEEMNAVIERGRLTGLVGPDGAGKTTLMRMMAALMAPSRGRIRVAGCDVVAEAAGVHQAAGYMPQRFGLYEDLSVIENLRLYASLRDIGEDGLDRTFERLLHFTRLEPFKARLAGRLSGGMKQKLGLACALMARPEVLLLDEPSVGVDPVSRRELWGMVQELSGEGMAVVWSTSYLDEAERCDSVLLLNEGKLEYAGPPRRLTARLAGRSFAVRGIEIDRRGALAETLELPDVRDGVIQGASIRAVLREGASPDALAAAVRSRGGVVETVAPRFEDAFIDLLGGGPGGRSAIAEKMDRVAASDEVAVSCRNLTKRFGSFVATDDVSFDVERGEIFGLLGPNGAGKSTTFKMLCGLLKPTSGEALVAGHDLRHAPGDAKLKLGYMAQKFSLYGLLSVRQNLEFFSGVYGLARKLRARRIDEMIETFELERYLGASPDALPLGYKQRLALACALMHRPPVLFLDEPTSGVDPITRREFWTHINAMVRRGVTVLVTTHFMDEAEYCDRVALMYRARVIALDSPDGLKAGTATPDLPEPTMEEAFISLVEAADEEARAAA